jgi:hypothetical protein
MIELFRLAAELQEVCQRQDWQFCFIGGIAVQRWGEPRVTQDVDMTILTGFGEESSYIDHLLKRFHPRIPDADAFALEHRVLLLESESGIGIDIALGGLPFEQLTIRRASLFAFLPEVALLTCSAEDLIVLKAFADRPRDWVDVENIILRQRQSLDWEHIERQLAPLVELKESPEILPRLFQLRATIERS